VSFLRFPEENPAFGKHQSAGGSVPWVEYLLTRLVHDFTGFWTGLGRLETDALRPMLDPIDVRRPVYITGLPRAGSTILLRVLSGIPGVATHRYSDFPFLFTPYWHNRFLSRLGGKGGAAVERAHADGIQVTPGSPEALEEILWMHFFPRVHDPAVSNILAEDVSHTEFPGFYRDHLRKLLLVRSGQRYLAKNNYAFTRLQYIRKLFPDARFILLVRDPVGHIASLMKQQLLFSRRYAGDPRALTRLRSMGHFEFGPDRRPVNTNDPVGTQTVTDYWDNGHEVQGWALYWRLVYTFVSRLLGTDDALREATLPVRFEDLCNSPGETLTAIARHCGFAGAEDAIGASVPTLRFPTYYDVMFNPDELRAIRDMTAEAAAGFGYR
jgi:hypothetical protein